VFRIAPRSLFKQACRIRAFKFKRPAAVDGRVAGGVPDRAALALEAPTGGEGVTRC
jgi:hypothetical protein